MSVSEEATRLLETAHSLLFVPGDRPDRFDRASTSADLAVLDLEDAVADSNKAAARAAVHEWLARDGNAVVRVNAAGTPWFTDDLAALRDLPGLRAIMLPKAESEEDARHAFNAGGGAAPVLALIETARGIANLNNIAGAEPVVRLAFGSIDYALDIGATESWDSLLFARSALVQAARVSDLTGPIDGVTTSIDDSEQITRDVRRARGLGFTGKLCIHPNQVSAVSNGFQPSSADIAWARNILNSDRAGAARIGGQMVDQPVRARAEQILASASDARNVN